MVVRLLWVLDKSDTLSSSSLTSYDKQHFFVSVSMFILFFILLLLSNSIIKSLKSSLNTFFFLLHFSIACMFTPCYNLILFITTFIHRTSNFKLLWIDFVSTHYMENNTNKFLPIDFVPTAYMVNNTNSSE